MVMELTRTRKFDGNSEVTDSKEDTERVAGVKCLWLVKPFFATLCRDHSTDLESIG